ncbi:GAF domain-containing protein [Pseudoroseicyclus aestuarii]|uniref:GAF domain-containing protein n=1 Tax=Pseudoroseicyclus aestuarii TaxID=1795041 RepID=A0A318SPB4_9RHOB|nr:GAF domain-containing protein [Pseudoroseicyclus aestuarii]PYE82435.1 GAF domain-containing protein [Pseudoroseicyclus aestuarii]
MTAWADLARALAGQDREELFAALCALAQQEVGVRLFTVMTFDPETRMASRTWSSMPEAYPPQGTKPAPETDWGQRVLDWHEPAVMNSIEEIAQHFPDHALIQSLGCESCMNLPVVVEGRVLGTLNCLHEAGHYTAARVEHAACLVAPGALALLRAREMPPNAEGP